MRPGSLRLRGPRAPTSTRSKYAQFVLKFFFGRQKYYEWDAARGIPRAVQFVVNELNTKGREELRPTVLGEDIVNTVVLLGA